MRGRPSSNDGRRGSPTVGPNGAVVEEPALLLRCRTRGRLSTVAVMVRRFGRAVAATVCSLGLLYLTIVLWLWWSQPPFDLSGIDGEVASDRLRSGSVLWPTLFSVLTIVAIVSASVAWRRARHRPPAFHRQ
jgi:hypothetical protein